MRNGWKKRESARDYTERLWWRKRAAVGGCGGHDLNAKMFVVFPMHIT